MRLTATQWWSRAPVAAPLQPGHATHKTRLRRCAPTVEEVRAQGGAALDHTLGGPRTGAPATAFIIDAVEEVRAQGGAALDHTFGGPRTGAPATAFIIDAVEEVRAQGGAALDHTLGGPRTGAPATAVIIRRGRGGARPGGRRSRLHARWPRTGAPATAFIIDAVEEVRAQGGAALGHTLDPGKTAAIANIPTPRNGWFRRVIPGYAEVAKPLTALVKKNIFIHLY
ncbi:hypothetical protein HW555_010928 [Spodoptera exigua]|uniref:Uncharacterized protein n=1 Tax=Spodoptera exigua TaxID=7107 RepID=A0A835G7X7_SPOEX|nr:hypothetical protein HW555_010928 [Spodoptera exigua]